MTSVRPLTISRLLRIPRLMLMGSWMAASLIGCQPPAGPDQPAGPKITGEEIAFPTNAPQLSSFTVETARTSPVESTELFGRLIWNGDATANIFSPVAGRVLRISAQLNQRVAAGEVLAEVDSPDYSQALADARTAAGNFAAADKAFARAKELLAHGAAAQKDVEAAEAACVAAGAEKERASARLANYGGRQDSPNALYRLCSPLAGVLVDRNLSPGQEIRADMMLANAPQLCAPLFVVTDPARLWVQLDIPENELRHLQPGAAVTLRTQAFPGETFAGTVEQISQALDATTRTVTVRGRVDNAAGKLKAEMLVTAELAAAGQLRLQVPARAVFLHGEQHYVFVAEHPGVFQRREVKLGETTDGKVEIVAGLQPGEPVVSDGALLLAELLE